MAIHSSTLAWKVPWTVERGRLQSMGSQRVGHDWVTSLHFSPSCIGEGNGNPLQCSCLENPRDRGAWWAAGYGVAQGRKQLKWLSSSSSISWEHILIIQLVNLKILDIVSLRGQTTSLIDFNNYKCSLWESKTHASQLGVAYSLSQ